MENDFQRERLDTSKIGLGGHGREYAELDAEARDQIIKFFNTQKETFNSHLGMRLVDVKKGYAKIEVENVPNLCQPAGIMHGGASFGVADASVAMALLGNYGPVNMLLTIEMKINYLEPIPMGKVTAEAYVLRSSKRSAYAEVDIWADGKLAARASTTYMIRPMKRDA